MDPDKKYFFIAPDDERVDGSRSVLDGLLHMRGKILSMSVDIFQVRERDLAALNPYLAAQHQRDWMEAMLERSILYFKNGPIEIEDLPEQYGMMDDHRNWMWLISFGNAFPAIIFFLKDYAWSHFILARDFGEEIVIAKRLKRIQDFYDIKFTAEQQALYEKRVFESCLHFYTYCNQTGVKSRKMIKSFLKSRKCSFTYEEIKEYWLNNDIPYNKLIP